MKAISIAPSLQWDGNNGPWSSFALQIGVPAQVVSVLPATSQSNIWAVLSDYCPYMTGVSDCADFRGGLYNPNSSTSFRPLRSDGQPYVDLPFYAESPLGYSGTAEAGTDVVRLGWSGGGEVLQQQAITAFAYTSPWLATGLIGLSDQPLNVSNAMDSHPSALATLRDTKKVPSTFWAYNAGARYLDPQVYASLTFGGYDADRGGDLNDALKVPMQQNNFRDIVVSIQAVSIGDGNRHVLDPDINAYVDSVVPELWLPESVCKVFEDAFDLRWNETAGMYLLDEEHRQQLYNTDAKVVFTLADPTDGSSTIDISFAYAAFDLEANYPLAGIQDDASLQYFPLKRANYSSQYYLGHTFLQEAYLAADYDRSEFYLSQADLLSNRPSIQTVHASGRKGLSEGATAGIAVTAVIIGLLSASLAAWFVCRPRWRRRRNSRFRARVEAQNLGLPDTQLPQENEMQMHEYYAKRPLSPGSDCRQELDATKTARGSIGTRAELESPGHSSTGSPRSKMSPRRQSYGFTASPAELESRSPRMMHSRTASGSSVEPMSPLSSGGRFGELGRTSEDAHELP